MFPFLAAARALIRCSFIKRFFRCVRVYTTFLSSHSVYEPNPIPENRPEAILARDAVNFNSIKKGRLKHLDPPNVADLQCLIGVTPLTSNSSRRLG